MPVTLRSVTERMGLTRLHARVPAGTRGELVLQPVEGDARGDDASSRGWRPWYEIRHPWSGATPCAAPRRGSWTPFDPEAPHRLVPPAFALDLARAPRGTDAATLVLDDVASPRRRTGREPDVAPNAPEVPSGNEGASSTGCSIATALQERRCFPWAGVLVLALLGASARQDRRRAVGCATKHEAPPRGGASWSQGT